MYTYIRIGKRGNNSQLGADAPGLAHSSELDGTFPLKAELNSIVDSRRRRVFRLLPNWLGRFLGSDLQLISPLVTGRFASKALPRWEQRFRFCSPPFAVQLW